MIKHIESDLKTTVVKFQNFKKNGTTYVWQA